MPDKGKFTEGGKEFIGFTYRQSKEWLE